MRRWLIWVLVAAFALAGCQGGEKKTGDDKADKPTIGLVLSVGGLGDKSFNDSAYEGLKRAEAEFGIAPVAQALGHTNHGGGVNVIGSGKHTGSG